jgi:hypothetical protein
VLDNCVIKSIVKKFLIGCLVFVAACQPADSAPATGTAPGKAAQPPPAPATATPGSTSTPTPLPTALPRFFSEEFEGSLPGWSVLQSNTEAPPQTYLQDGSLILELSESFSWAYAIIGTETYADVRIDALTQSRASSPEAIGLVCRYDEQAGWYEFNIFGDRTYSVLYGHWLAEGVARYIPIAIDSSQYLNPSGADNEIGLACQDTILWLYINGKLFRKLNETRFLLTEGKVGLSVSSFENTPVDASFDWVRVSEPTE